MYSIPAYGLLNGKLTWNFDTHNSKHTMKLSLWGKNILNKDYLQHTIGMGAAPYIPNETVPFQTGYYYASQAYGAKSMIGGQVQLRVLGNPSPAPKRAGRKVRAFFFTPGKAGGEATSRRSAAGAGLQRDGVALHVAFKPFGDLPLIQPELCEVVPVLAEAPLGV